MILCPLLSMIPCRDECAHRMGGKCAEVVKAEALISIREQLAVLAKTAQEQFATARQAFINQASEGGFKLPDVP